MRTWDSEADAGSTRNAGVCENSSESDVELEATSLSVHRSELSAAPDDLPAGPESATSYAGYAVYVVFFVALHFALRNNDADPSHALRDQCITDLCFARIEHDWPCEHCPYQNCERTNITAKTRFLFSEVNRTAYVDIHVPNIIVHPKLINASFQTTFHFFDDDRWTVNILILRKSAGVSEMVFNIFQAESSPDIVTAIMDNIDKRPYSRIKLGLEEFNLTDIPFGNEFGGVTLGVKFRRFENYMRLYFCSYNICKRHGDKMGFSAKASTDEYTVAVISFVDSPDKCAFELYEPLEVRAQCRIAKTSQVINQWVTMD